MCFTWPKSWESDGGATIGDQGGNSLSKGGGQLERRGMGNKGGEALKEAS